METIAIGLSMLCLLFIILFYAVHYSLYYLSTHRNRFQFFRWRKGKWKLLKRTEKHEENDNMMKAA